MENKLKDLRKKAEKKIIDNDFDIPTKPAEIKKLIHELQVYQVELEMQNEELIKNQARLEQSHDQLSVLYHHAPNGFLVLNNKFEVVHCNDTFLTMLSCDLDHIINKNFVELVISDDRDIFLGRIKAFFKDPYLKRMELHLRCKRNTILHIEFKAKKVDHFSIGKELNENVLLVSIHDISELKNTEKKLRSMQERLDLIIKGSSDAAWDWDFVNHTIYYAPQWGKQLGYKTEEIPTDDEHWYNILHPEDKKMADELMNKALNSDLTQYEIEFRMMHKKGHYVPILSRGYITRNQAGEIVRISGTNLDLTEMKKVESKIRDREKLLRFSIEQNPVPTIIATAPDAHIQYFNKAAQNLLTQEIADLKDIPLEKQREYWPTYHPDGTQYKISDLPLTKAIQKGIITENEEIIVRHPQKDRWINANAAPLYDENGKIISGIVCFPEITQQKEFEQKLKSKTNEMEAIFKSMLNAFVVFDSVFDENGKFISYRFVFINDAYEQITDVKNNEVKGKTVHEVWPGTENSWIEKYGHVATTGETLVFDNYHEPTKKLYHCRVFRPWESNKRFCVIFDDVTQIRKSEQQLKERLNELEIFHTAAVDRELVINEHRRELNKLLKELGREPKYTVID